MLTFWKQDNGLKQVKKYEKNSWINVVAPTQEEISYLTDIQRVPLDFITDILDIDERSRSEVEGRWLLIFLFVFQPIAFKTMFLIIRFPWEF